MPVAIALQLATDDLFPTCTRQHYSILGYEEQYLHVYCMPLYHLLNQLKAKLHGININWKRHFQDEVRTLTTLKSQLYRDTTEKIPQTKDKQRDISII